MVATKEISGAMGLDKEQLLDLHYKMLLARTVGQRERMLNRMGKGPFAVTGEGHEATQVGTAYPLRQKHDWVVPYYRDIGVALVMGQTPLDLLLAHLSREERHQQRRAQHALALQRSRPAHRLGFGAGRDASPARRRNRPGIEAARPRRGHRRLRGRGWHQHRRLPRGDELRRRPQAAGHLHHARTTCTRSPSTGGSRPPSRTSRCAAKGYGFPGVTVDGNDVLAVYAAMKEAADRARNGDGPTFIEGKTYRLFGHTR